MGINVKTQRAMRSIARKISLVFILCLLFVSRFKQYAVFFIKDALHFFIYKKAFVCCLIVNPTFSNQPRLAKIDKQPNAFFCKPKIITKLCPMGSLYFYNRFELNNNISNDNVHLVFFVQLMSFIIDLYFFFSLVGYVP